MERINKFLAHLGIASRRKIDRLIEEKLITINGNIANKGDKIDPVKDQIFINGKAIVAKKEKLIYLILNKPKNVLSTVLDNRGRPTVIDYIRQTERLYPVGRLDFESTGLILMTNDGELAFRITHPRYHLPKTYLVTLTNAPNPSQLDLLRSGVPLEDGITSKSEVIIFHRNNNNIILKITIYEGKNRQIRRMCSAVGLDLVALHRISIGPISLGKLEVGESRLLTSSELNLMKKSVNLLT